MATVTRMLVEWADGFSVEHVGEDAQAVWNLTGLQRQLPIAAKTIDRSLLSPMDRAPFNAKSITARILTPARTEVK